MKKITKKSRALLEQLGLTPTQSQIYLAALAGGVISVIDLAKETGISRQQIYNDAQKLVDMGVLDLTRKERRKYIAAHPATLEKLAQKKIHNAENILKSVRESIPALEQLIPKDNSSAIVKFFEGKKNIKIAYQRELDVVRNSEVLSLAGSIDDIFKFFPESYWKKWNATFVRQGSSSRMLAHNSPAARETKKHDTAYHRETRLLPSFPLKVNIDVFNQTVLIVSFYDEIALWIESPVVAESYRILFNILWEQAK